MKRTGILIWYGCCVRKVTSIVAIAYAYCTGLMIHRKIFRRYCTILTQHHWPVVFIVGNYMCCVQLENLNKLEVRNVNLKTPAYRVCLTCFYHTPNTKTMDSALGWAVMIHGREHKMWISASLETHCCPSPCGMFSQVVAVSIGTFCIIYSHLFLFLMILLQSWLMLPVSDLEYTGVGTKQRNCGFMIV